MGWARFTTIVPLDEYDSNQTLDNNNKYALVDASNSATTITLSDVTNELTEHVVKKIDSSVNKVTVKPDSGQIDGQDYIELTNQYNYVRVKSDGTNWWIIGGVNVKLDTQMETLNDNLISQSAMVEKLLFLTARMERMLDDSTDTEIENPTLIEEIKALEVDLS